jgi:putative methyltransferase (TIGR04325 family)
MNDLRSLVKEFFPPILLRLLNKITSRSNYCETDMSNWDDINSYCDGYDKKEILKKVLEATIKVKNGEAAFERDSVVFEHHQYVWFVLTGLMWVAARHNGVLNVLDFGGSLGSSYFQNRRFLKSIPDVTWSVVEQKHYVDAANKHIKEERLRFYKTIEECLLENKPNVIILSSVLQYLESPSDILDEINKVGAKCLILDRTPFYDGDKDRLIVQNVPSAIYSASYPMWIFSRKKFNERIDQNWKKIESNVSPEGQNQTNKGLLFSFQGMLFESR